MGSNLNYLVLDPILFVGCPWRATADLVRGRVFKQVYRCYFSIATKNNAQISAPYIPGGQKRCVSTARASTGRPGVLQGISLRRISQRYGIRVVY